MSEFSHYDRDIKIYFPPFSDLLYYTRNNPVTASTRQSSNYRSWQCFYCTVPSFQESKVLGGKNGRNGSFFSGKVFPRRSLWRENFLQQWARCARTRHCMPHPSTAAVLSFGFDLWPGTAASKRGASWKQLCNRKIFHSWLLSTIRKQKREKKKKLWDIARYCLHKGNGTPRNALKDE